MFVTLEQSAYSDPLFVEVHVRQPAGPSRVFYSSTYGDWGAFASKEPKLYLLALVDPQAYELASQWFENTFGLADPVEALSLVTHHLFSVDVVYDHVAREERLYLGLKSPQDRLRVPYSAAFPKRR